MILREFWTNIRSTNNELNLFGNLLAGNKNIGLANCRRIDIYYNGQQVEMLLI